MLKTINDFKDFRVGDIVTLSDIQTQTEYSKMSVDFPIKGVLSYTEPNGFFKYYGYMIEAPNHDIYLILLKTMKENFEAYVFFKDIGASGPLFEAPAGVGVCPLHAFFNETGLDFVSRFEAQVTDQTGTHPVVWDKQVSTYGIKLRSTVDGEGICSLGEYYTSDENGGNNYCMLDWKGTVSKGFIETWYGCPIKNSEIEFFHK